MDTFEFIRLLLIIVNNIQCNQRLRYKLNRSKPQNQFTTIYFPTNFFSSYPSHTKPRFNELKNKTIGGFGLRASIETKSKLPKHLTPFSKIVEKEIFFQNFTRWKFSSNEFGSNVVFHIEQVKKWTKSTCKLKTERPFQLSSF